MGEVAGGSGGSFSSCYRRSSVVIRIEQFVVNNWLKRRVQSRNKQCRRRDTLEGRDEAHELNMPLLRLHGKQKPPKNYNYRRNHNKVVPAASEPLKHKKKEVCCLNYSDLNSAA